MSVLRRLARSSLGLVASLLSVAAFGGTALWFFAHSSLPQTGGQAALAGLRGGVSVERDGDGIPHIRAVNALDAYFALGFVHAQDRLWQMESMRRLGAGRLSEALGPQTLNIDRSMRGLGIHRLAAQVYDGLAPDVRAALDAYAGGVNAYLANHRGAWPLEYYLLRLRPEPWTPVDSLVWGQLMGLRLAGDWRGELTRFRLSQRLSPAQVEQLLDTPAEGPVTVEESLHRRASATPARRRADGPPPVLSESLVAGLLRLLPDAIGPHSASNSWVLSGERTASGKPILANDPHLALELPNTWYLARITAPGLTVAGATAPGVPFHVLGHNGRVAWGFTNTGSDVQDLFVERTDPADPSRYLTPEGSAPFAVRRETIRVRGGDDVVLTIRETRHGPVVSDLMNEPMRELPPGDMLAFASAGLRGDDKTPEALYHLNRARDWDGFVRAMHLFHSPQQNISYADIDGNIGIYVAGRVPIRKRGEGLLPVPGWTGEHDWTGFVPPEALPHSYNPASGRIANANNRVVGPDYPYPLGRDWTDSFRIRRLEDLLAATPKHDPDGTARILGDVTTLVPARLLPLMLPALRAMPLDEGRYAGIVDMLEIWDGQAVMNRPQPLMFNAWLFELARRLAADELGDMAGSVWGLRPSFVADALTRHTAWCDDVTTTEPEGCGTIVQRAFITAMDGLAAVYGDDPGRWKWGEAHRAPLPNRVMNRVPLLRALADASIATPGDDATINRGTTSLRNPRAPFAHVHGAGLRAIYDLADLDASRFIIAGGQSGNLLSPHYSDQVRRWRDVQFVALPARGEPHQRLVLTPKP